MLQLIYCIISVQNMHVLCQYKLLLFVLFCLVCLVCIKIKKMCAFFYLAAGDIFYPERVRVRPARFSLFCIKKGTLLFNFKTIHKTTNNKQQTNKQFFIFILFRIRVRIHVGPIQFGLGFHDRHLFKSRFNDRI